MFCLNCCRTALIFITYFALVSTKWLHNITISKDGKDDLGCLRKSGQPCLTLDYALRGVLDQKSTNSTMLIIHPGSYQLNSSFTFWYTKQFAITGATLDSQEVVVNCSFLSGLSFINSRDIVFQNITFSSCGAVQNSTTRNHPEFLAGLFVVNCINLVVKNVWVVDGPGIGMQLYDVAGIVVIEDSYFLRNGNKTNKHGYVNSGGGLYLEHTFDSGLWPFEKSTNTVYQQNGIFRFINLIFDENVAPYPNISNDVIVPNASNHVAFGRGGGISMFLKGKSANNSFEFYQCHFNKNYALFGAGYFVELQDKANKNRINFNNSTFCQNTAEFGGGAIRAGLIRIQKTDYYVPNIVKFSNCYFKKNKAIFGGAFSLYGTTKVAYSKYPENRYVNFSFCLFEENYATVGSALSFSLWSIVDIFSVGNGLPIIIFFRACNLTKNQIILTEDRQVSGSGALYSNGMPLLLNNVDFTSNNGTALVLDNAVTQIHQNVLFENNTGQNGGGIALYGVSRLDIAKKAQLIFVENKCHEKGGAIFVRTPGPQMVAFETTQLNTHGCFFQSSDDRNGFYPNKWDFNVSFIGNKCPYDSSGHSVFATTLQYCRQPGQSRINNSTLQWKSFNYFYSNESRSDMIYEIVTNAVKMEINNSEWNVTTDKYFSPTLQLIDEKNNSVYGIINIELVSSSKSRVTLSPPSAYHLAKDHIQSLKIEGVPETIYDVQLSTVGSQLVSKGIFNVHIGECSPGYIFKNNLCVCDVNNIGISRCEDKNQSLVLVKGFWGGYINSKGEMKFVTALCPYNYCYCYTNHLLSASECFFNMQEQCSGNRQGRLCGECKNNFSLNVGEDDCVNNCNVGLNWLGYLIGFILFLTFLVLVIIFINFDPFSAYLNAWLYSYQVILFLLPEGITLDRFLLFIVGLANVRLLGFGGICMWPKLDDLQKLALNYLFPVYVMFCLFMLNRLALMCNNRFTQYLTQTSTARAFCTLFVLSYSTVTYVSLNILYPAQIGDKYYVFYQGTEEYFGSYHAWFAITAILLLIFVGILFPLMLIRRQWFGFFDTGLTRLLLDNFQNPFRDGYEWFAGFYFVCRFILLITSMVPDVGISIGLQQCACSLILGVFALCRPYKESEGLVSLKVLNISDLILLCNLCVLTSFSGSLSSISYSARSYYKPFQILIYISGYIPLLFFFCILFYFLCGYFRSRRHVALEENVF